MNSLKRLSKEYNDYVKNPNSFYSICPRDNFLIWDFLIFGPSDSIFDGMLFKGVIEFPVNYPIRPPKVYFVNNYFHPNIYSSGKICISILNEGVDDTGYQSISERWRPNLNVDTILMSILNIINEPNLESPANVDATKLWRTNFNEYKKIIYKAIREQD